MSLFYLFLSVKARSVASNPNIVKEKVNVVPCTRYAFQWNLSGLAYRISTVIVDAIDAKVKILIIPCHTKQIIEYLLNKVVDRKAISRALSSS